MSKFDIASIFQDVPEMDTGRKQIEYIPLDKIHADPNNGYEVGGIEELAANIEMFGLQQPLELRPHGELEGHFVITSGHRRRAALELLNEIEAPCIVVEACASPALQELRLIFANSDTRKMSPAEQAWQAERIEKLLYDLKEQGYKFTGRMRDYVAALTGMSRSKLARLSVIRKGLKPTGLVKAFEDGRLNESVAYEIAHYRPEAQELADEQLNMLCRLNADEVRALMESLEKEVEDDARMKEQISTNLEKLETPTAVEGRNPPKAVRDYLEQREEEDFKFRMWLKALVDEGDIDLPGWYGSRKLSIDGLKALLRYRGGGNSHVHYAGSGSGFTVRKWGEAELMRSWTDTYDALCGIALEASRLAGKACPNSDTVAGWQSGTPENGKYYCKVNCDGALVRQILIYNDGWKLLSGLHPLDDACEVEGWWPLPEE